jgi:peptidoglycan/xylan/chitin deacetylase (PgdA/CDA1 family)
VSYVPERNFVGYGRQPPNARWPNGARVALNFVLNYEEGAEYSPQEGDSYAETLLSEQPPGKPEPGQRDRNMESLYEFGSRVGVWRIVDLFKERAVPLTAYVVGRALELNPAVGEAIAEAGCDVIGHGWRWIDHQFMGVDQEREHIARTAKIIARLTGALPTGWYSGRPSLRTRQLVVEHGGFLFDSDDYNDELPYFVDVDGTRHLVIPHSFDTNDSRFARGAGLETSEEFFSYLRDSLDWLLLEGQRIPRLMTVSLHCRLIGRPGRMMGLAQFLNHATQSEKVWICRRTDIARHWYATNGR